MTDYRGGMTVVTKERSDADARITGDPAPRQLIVTLFGLYGRAEKNWLSVAALVRLMGELGVDGPAVRSSISRLKRREVLASSRRGTSAGYSMSPWLLDVLAEGDARIFGRTRASIDDGWLVVVFSVPESERENRHALRTELTRLGFGTAASGVWIAPGTSSARFEKPWSVGICIATSTSSTVVTSRSAICGPKSEIGGTWTN